MIMMAITLHITFWSKIRVRGRCEYPTIRGVYIHVLNGIVLSQICFFGPAELLVSVSEDGC